MASQTKREETHSILSYLRLELRYIDEELRKDGLLPEINTVRSLYEQLNSLYEKESLHFKGLLYHSLHKRLE